MPGGGAGPSRAALRRQRIKQNTARFLALRQTSAQELSLLLAKNCVKRGVRWLSRHAPYRGWWRNCLNNGHSRVCTSHDNSGILALVYEYEPRMANKHGYVTDAVVLQKLGFGFPSRRASRLGFIPGSYIGGWKPFPKRYDNVVITCDVLDIAWAKFLNNPPPEMRANYRHPTALDRRLARMSFTDGKARPWRFWFWNLKQLFRWPPWRHRPFETYTP